MRLSRKVFDLMILAISCWAVLATSRVDPSGHLPLSRLVSESAKFSVLTDCDNSPEREGTINMGSNTNHTLFQMRGESNFGFPTGVIHQKPDDPSERLGYNSLIVKGLTRVCSTTIDGDFFDVAGSIPFICYDEGSTEPACTVTLTLQSFETKQESEQ